MRLSELEYPSNHNRRGPIDCCTYFHFDCLRQDYSSIYSWSPNSLLKVWQPHLLASSSPAIQVTKLHQTYYPRCDGKLYIPNYFPRPYTTLSPPQRRVPPPAHMARWRLHGARHRTARSQGTDSFTRAAHHISGWSPFSRRCARIIRYRKIPSTTTDEAGEELLVGVKGADRDSVIHGGKESDIQQPGVMGRMLNEVGRAFSYGTISL